MDFVTCTRGSHEPVDVILRLMKVQGSLNEMMKNGVKTNKRWWKMVLKQIRWQQEIFNIAFEIN